MYFRCALIGVFLFIGCLNCQGTACAQEAPAPLPETPAPVGSPASGETTTTKGVEVLARGPVHEAFASPSTEPVPIKPVRKHPPKPLEEMPPEQKPEGEVVWIGGYWAWDDERNDFLWVSGIWRKVPPGKTWVAGYWKDEGDQTRWVPGFWTAANSEGTAQEVTYLPAPPAPPEMARPGEAPEPDSFFVPGAWVWSGDHYGWRAGYWARVQPGYLWVAAHYRWTPSGYVYIPGYWDLTVANRGVLYAPVIVDEGVVGATFVYTPTYVVRDTLVLDAMFVRPCYCHYYFGDYYGPAYRELGYESCIVYSNRCYDPIFVYARWEHRAEPNWVTVQIDICQARHAGVAPLPPRTLVQQNIVVRQNITNVTNVTNIYRNTPSAQGQGLVLASQMSASMGRPTVALDSAHRLEMRNQAQAVRQVSLQRNLTENSAVGSPGNQGPRTATLNLPPSFPRKANPIPTNPTFTSTVSPGLGTMSKTGSSNAASSPPAIRNSAVLGNSLGTSSASGTNQVIPGNSARVFPPIPNRPGLANPPSGSLSGLPSSPLTRSAVPGTTLNRPLGKEPYRPLLSNRPSLTSSPPHEKHPVDKDRP